MAYTIGLDFGTNSVRALLVDVSLRDSIRSNGNEVGQAVYEYETGEAGIILDSADHNLARQNPADYLKGIEVTIKAAINEAGSSLVARVTGHERRVTSHGSRVTDFDTSQIIGIGIDTTGSTPIPVDKNGTPLSMLDEFTPPGYGAVPTQRRYV